MHGCCQKIWTWKWIDFCGDFRLPTPFPLGFCKNLVQHIKRMFSSPTGRKRTPDLNTFLAFPKDGTCFQQLNKIGAKLWLKLQVHWPLHSLFNISGHILFVLASFIHPLLSFVQKFWNDLDVLDIEVWKLFFQPALFGVPNTAGAFDGSAIGNGTSPVNRCSWKSPFCTRDTIYLYTCIVHCHCLQKSLQHSGMYRLKTWSVRKNDTKVTHNLNSTMPEVISGKEQLVKKLERRGLWTCICSTL